MRKNKICVSNQYSGVVDLIIIRKGTDRYNRDQLFYFEHLLRHAYGA